MSNCKPKIKRRVVPCPYRPGQKTEERTLWCATCKVKIGGQVASANSEQHREAQKMVERGWADHVSRQLPASRAAVAGKGTAS